MFRRGISIVLVLLPCALVRAQVVLPDSNASIEMSPVVVTATRAERSLDRVPVPTTLITAEEIRARGALRLSDVLAEETGLMLIDDHGTGVQLQGFDPAYTLILIDGEPVIGRTAGTLDLDRLSVADVERIEVVRGPSSSLYGSEALAGVINIITRSASEGVGGSIHTRVETHGTTNLAAHAEARRERLGVRVTADRHSSDGYDLSPGITGATVPQFTDYMASVALEADLHRRTDLSVTTRLSAQDQQNQAVVQEGGAFLDARDRASRTDWSISPRLVHRFGGGVVLTGKAYAARYRTRTELVETEGGTVLNLSRFDQRYHKAEVQLDALVARSHLVTAGAGFVDERVSADRIRGDDRSVSSLFGLIQHEFSPVSWTDVISSGRIDVHSAYGVRVSPKVATLIRPADRLRVRVSVGSGFKAPTFQQLYLDFTNPTAGYSVVGSVDAPEALLEAEEAGQVARFLTALDGLGEVGPETSVAMNVGLEVDPYPWMEARLNLFHNEVRNLIETAPVAVKQNGQSIFTYFNLNRIYTRGLEAEVALRPLSSVTVAGGYQLLDAKDRDVLSSIADGTLYKRVDGRDRRVTADEYGGLMNRSRHAFNLRLQFDRPGFNASLRGQYRSRYGYGDLNGNLVLDDASEYVAGYWLWHVTLSRELLYGFSAQVGARNLLNRTEPSRIPSLSGRLLYAGLHIDL